MSESIQQKLVRNRPPRVKITYDVETGGAIEKKELPFIVGIFADLSGDTPFKEKPPLKERRPVDIDAESFDSVLSSFAPGVTFEYSLPVLPENADEADDGAEASDVPADDDASEKASKPAKPAKAAKTSKADKSSDDEPEKTSKAVLEFNSLEDFTPLSIVLRFEPLAKFYHERRALRDFQSRVESDEEIETAFNNLVQQDDDSLAVRKKIVKVMSDPTTWETVDLSSVMDSLPPSYEDYTSSQQKYFRVTLGYICQLILEPLADKKLDGYCIHHADVLVSKIDTEMTQLLNMILHDANFQKLEASWRGLHHLVSQSETGTSLKIKVLNLSQSELQSDLEKSIAFDQSHIFKLIYEAEYGTFGGHPYSLLVGDYYFGRDPMDMNLLEKITEVAAGAHAPFLAAADPSMFGLKSFVDLAKPRDLAKVFESPELNQWNSFRQTEDSRYVSLTLPKVMLRLPYGDKRSVADGVRFEEEVVIPVIEEGEVAPTLLIDEDYVEPQGHINTEHCIWGNPAYFLAQRITNAFSLYGWTAAIRGVEGGGLLENLPNLTYSTKEGDIGLQCPTMVSITDRREKELNDLGFISACHCKGTNMASFFGGQTTNQPKKYISDSANSNAELSARLPYMLAASRFAHYVKVLMRDKIGSFSTRASVQAYLNEWIAQYILLDDQASQEIKAAFPLREARIDVTEIPGNPGAYNAVLFLRPHFQLEELTTSIRLVAQLPQ